MDKLVFVVTIQSCYFNTGSHRQVRDKWTGLCANKTLFANTGKGLDLALHSTNSH